MLRVQGLGVWGFGFFAERNGQNAQSTKPFTFPLAGVRLGGPEKSTGPLRVMVPPGAGFSDSGLKG